MFLLDVSFLIPHFDSGRVLVLQGVNLYKRKRQEEVHILKRKLIIKTRIKKTRNIYPTYLLPKLGNLKLLSNLQKKKNIVEN